MRKHLELLSPERSTQAAFLLFLVTSPAYGVCRFNHFWCHGHYGLADNATPIEYVTDGLLIVGFVLSVLLAFRSDISFRYVFLYGLGIGLVCYSAPNILVCGVYVALLLFAVGCLLGWIC